jgi:hypothetical protein
MVMDKQNDDVHYFRHRWNHMTMSSWIYTKQFNYLVRSDQRYTTQTALIHTLPGAGPTR